MIDPEAREKIRAVILRLADIPDDLLADEPEDDGPDCGA